MTPEAVRRRFREIGARATVAEWDGDGHSFFRIGIDRTHRSETFNIAVRRVSVDAPDVDPRRRQLLLLASWTDRDRRPVESRYLCGFDERHWFAAALRPTPDLRVVTVADAHEALKPLALRLTRSTNPGPLRQGEWFFIPRPDLQVDVSCAMRGGALQRGDGRPHLVQYLVGPSAALWRWGRPEFPTFARGWVRHRDHRTLRLPFWHEVELNEEDVATIGLD